MRQDRVTSSWERPGLLRDGRSVLVRPIHVDDAEALTAFGNRLSRRTISYRLLGPVVRISDGTLRAWADVDQVDHIALVAFLGARLIGGARCLRAPEEPDQGEATFTIEDDFQGLGLGALLLERLAQAARARGVTTMTADVLADNTRMLRAFAGSGYRTETVWDGSVVHVTMATDPGAQTVARSDRREHVAVRSSLRPLLRPRSIAVVGAGRRPETIGHEILRNLVAHGFGGPVHPVNPHADQIAGVPAFPSLRDLPEPVDLVIVAVPAEGVEEVVREASTVGAGAVVVVSTGFGETGPAGLARERRLVQAARAAGMRLVGPNCMGLVSRIEDRTVFATFAPRLPPPGAVSMSSRSGPLGLAVLTHAEQLGLGFASFVSIGNAADVSTNDLLQWWEEDPATGVILLHLDRFGNPRKFARVARRIAARKPIVAVHAGVPTLSGRASGATRDARPVTGADTALDALFQQSGIIRTRSLGAMFDVALLLANQPVPGGNRVAIVTNAGGPGALTADACRASGLVVAEHAGADLGPTATAADYQTSLTAALADPAVDAAIVLYVPPLVRHVTEVAAAIASAAAAAPDKPVVTSFLSASGLPSLLRREGRAIPSYVFPEAAATALGAAAAYGAWRRSPAGVVITPRDPDRAAARALLDDQPAGPVGPDAVRALLRGYGIPVPVSGRAAAGQPAAGQLAAGQPAAGEEPGAVDVAVGVTTDPVFGPVVTLALAGDYADLVGDVALRVTPLSSRDAPEMTRSLRAFPLLDGWRGAPRCDVAALEDVLLRVSALVEDLPRVTDLAIRPLRVFPEGGGVAVLEARLTLASPDGAASGDAASGDTAS
ncbi:MULTISPECIES: bifunctional acetate--CoA ligase family protein/GNAT family N-acetyltransferase [Pseudofrankia]|uniref:bifunctional acetate--CoA ligase family protein/GNAT family N-acetyltransferase n=1 Tax=Pseudofrankia TaxID=2994363 RepID=UPI000234B0EB|nr:MULTISPECIES: GNAT family N-acetyltransferase [Pseudofrankia]OHV32318.1 GNAT family N-acetyltransferase [Pseudofrankia sp. EUN1h]